ncbi:class I SAM-dependent methyltransferase [Tannockella kyphosi]|uniref:class I SAM-dependent methyltransferase n=1 Tax=Tannockella kyphosi TaxID=2899121 RepID=UPI00201185A5|nr:class I SAM-dependent methyltransferase [Tannockella kyphosi]
MKDNSNKKFWERIAKLYTAFQEKGNKDLYVSLCQKIKPQINENQEVLELACGTGQLTVFLANSSKHWIATDFSTKMVLEAKKRFNTKKVSYEIQDATKLSYEDHMFDVVLIANALHIMPQPDEALKEIRRVLKPNGILIAPTFVYEAEINKVRLLVMEKIGFKTFYQWTSKE